MEQYEKIDKLNIRVLNAIDEQEHFHQDIELIYILEGCMDVVMGEQTTRMEPEDILVINANKRHCLKADADILFAQFSIQYHLISSVFQNSDVIFWCDSTKEESDRYEELRKVLKALLNHYLETKGNIANFGHIALSYRVLDILSMYFLVHAADKEKSGEQDKFEDRISQINNYIRANYNQPISLKELSDKLYLSNGYLSRFFKRNYGMSFAEYLTNIRLFHAVDDLLYTSTPITRIAFDNGFASVAVFNKVFKKAYGETPSTFRKKSKEQKKQSVETEQNEIVEERLEQYLIMNNGDKVEEGSVDILKNTYSAASAAELKNIWGNLMNFGAASDLLKSEVREHVILLKEALGFKYVRFWNLFLPEMLMDMKAEGADFNFARLDSVLDFLLQQGLKPHIELGLKPKWIMRNVQELVMAESSSTEFESVEQWSTALEAIIRHLVYRYGREEVNSWRMELWFDEKKWGQKETTEEYYERFNVTYRIIKKYCESLEVGGCGLRLDFNEKSRISFLEGWNRQECRPDFISIIYYPYDRGEIEQDRYAKRNTNNENMKHRILHEKELFERIGLGDLKIYVTEWNLTASDRNYMNDSTFKGAYIIKNVLDLYGQVEDMGYHFGSDRISEYYDSSDMLHGGKGLISRDGILKPAGFAFEFLQRLYPYYVGNNEHYLISTDKHSSYGIVCHNQKVLSYNYFFAKEDEIEKEHLWKYFENRDILELDLVLEDVEDGSYQVKTHRINDQNGSALNIWAETEYEKELSRNDIKYFRRVCEPKLTIQKLEAKKGRLHLNIRLLPNEIAFIRIRLLV